jgi:hypothetical protein
MRRLLSFDRLFPQQKREVCLAAGSKEKTHNCSRIVTTAWLAAVPFEHVVRKHGNIGGRIPFSQEMLLPSMRTMNLLFGTDILTLIYILSRLERFRRREREELWAQPQRPQQFR